MSAHTADRSLWQNGVANKITAADRPFHSWYRFILSFPPHLVAAYFKTFQLDSHGVVLDPFCGTGTTVVEAKRHQIASVGIEANPIARLVSQVKTTWDIDSHQLVHQAQEIADAAFNDPTYLSRSQLETLPPAAYELLLKNSMGEIPLHKALVLLKYINADAEGLFYPFWQVAFAKAIVKHCSNLHFRPEVGLRHTRRHDAAVAEHWLATVKLMAADLQQAPVSRAPAHIYWGDARDVTQFLQPQSIDVVFTSPPYPNEKDYTRATRLETVLLGFIANKQDLRRLKQGLLRSNSRNIYRGDTDGDWIERHASIVALAEQIEARRLELGKNSGFAKKYARVTRCYFGGMARHFASLRPFLKPGARLGYVVGDQASFFQTMIRTGQLLAEIAADLGYQVEDLDLFRTRRASATEERMREEVLRLRWPG